MSTDDFPPICLPKECKLGWKGLKTIPVSFLLINHQKINDYRSLYLWDKCCVMNEQSNDRLVGSYLDGHQTFLM